MLYEVITPEVITLREYADGPPVLLDDKCPDIGLRHAADGLEDRCLALDGQYGSAFSIKDFANAGHDGFLAAFHDILVPCPTSF